MGQAVNADSNARFGREVEWNVRAQRLFEGAALNCNGLLGLIADEQLRFNQRV